MGASFYYLRMLVNLTQNCAAVGTFSTWKSIFQQNHNTFSFLNYVNINSFQSYSLSTFILFIFLFLGLKHNGHKTSMKFFCLVSFSDGFFAKHFFLAAKPLSFIEWRRWNKSITLREAYQYATGTCIVYLLIIMLIVSLRAYIVFHKFNIICLSETYFDSSNPPDDETLEISGYNLVRSDHPLNSKHGGVCI